MKSLVILFAIILAGSFAFGQAGQFKNGGSYTNTGTMSVTNFQNYKSGGGTFTNSGTVTISGTGVTAFDNNLPGAVVNNNSGGIIDMTGAGGTFANGAGSVTNNAGAFVRISGLVSNSGTLNTTAGTFEYKGTSSSVYAGVTGAKYANLIITGATAKSLAGSIIVDTLVTLNAGTAFSEGAANSLTLNGSSAITGSGTLTADGTTIYNHSGASQTVYTSTYNNLTLQNGGTKTANGTVSVNGTLTNATQTTFDLGSNQLTTGGSSTITNNPGATIQTAGNVTFGTVHTIGGLFKYDGGSPQNVGTANYDSLDLSGAGSKTFPSGVVGVSGAYTIQGGTGTRTYTGSTFAYNGTTAQPVLGSESYDSLRIVGTADTSIHKTLTIGNLPAGVRLNIAANATLDMGSFGFAGAPSANAANYGKIMWAAGNSNVIPGSGTTQFYGSGNIAAGTYGNVLLSSGTLTIPGSTSVTSTAGSGTAGFFILSGSTLNLSTATSSLTVTGQDLDNSGTITNAGSIVVN